MFWRKKKIAFRDWALIALLSDAAKSPHVETLMAKVMALESMKLGIAVGAQFPTKVFPIIRQVSGDDSENAYAQVKESLQNWVDSNADIGIVLEHYPLITEPEESLRSRRVGSLARGNAILWAINTFFYGLLMGSLYKSLFLEALESAIRAENMGWELTKESAPNDLGNL